MDKWLDAYALWPPMNQLIFSCVALLAFLVVLFLFGLWLIMLARYIAVARRGWPHEPHAEITALRSEIARLTREAGTVSGDAPASS